jgi:hypothetical protein
MRYCISILILILGLTNFAQAGSPGSNTDSSAAVLSRAEAEMRAAQRDLEKSLNTLRSRLTPQPTVPNTSGLGVPLPQRKMTGTPSIPNLAPKAPPLPPKPFVYAVPPGEQLDPVNCIVHNGPGAKEDWIEEGKCRCGKNGCAGSE